ncbi:MAG: hypothetical protein KGD63_03545 [Candidatus Lokiarchaeota archaeon]|nr:hypothetical protein [Candidatus Lokiarchaeota archaeon]
MIRKDFSFQESELNYSIIINRIHLEKKGLTLNDLFQIIKELQNKYQNSIIQFFNDFYVLDEKQIFNSIYYTQKAYIRKRLISNNQNIEFLLYLSAKRQIKVCIDSFGISEEDIDKGILNYCVVSNKETLDQINQIVSEKIDFKEIELNYDNKTIEKYDRIKEFYEINENQIKSVLNSLDDKYILENIERNDINLLFEVLNDLLCEKMVLLSLKGIKLE